MVTNQYEHDRIAELFAAAYEMDAGDRAAYLDAHCADDAVRREVEALLLSHARPGDFLETPALGPDFRPPEPNGEANDERIVGGRIGSYRLTRVIASGGMGVVYEAEQERPERLVALKVMRHAIASESTRRRFEYESELLGRLSHPGIARVYDAGLHALVADDGDASVEVPWFAMELIAEARPITDYASTHSLALADRLELLANVCDAIHHGHQRGIIHRDVKPANILVGADDRAKVIDFGIARAIDADGTASMHTGVGQILGTLPYMSHEQLAGDPSAVDVRADVYALGVVMYEMLAGRLPYDLAGKNVGDAIVIMRDRDPEPLGTTDRLFRGDLETIVGKAIDRDRERRYASASELAADIRRYLHDEPVAARRPSILYQVRKMARRHRAAFAATVAAVVILVAATVTASGLTVEANRQRDDAERMARALAGLITNGQRQGSNVVVPMREIADLVDDVLPDPEAQADLHRLLAKHWRQHDHTPRAEHHLTRQLELRRAHPGPHDTPLVRALEDLSTFELSRGRLEPARAYIDEALAVRRARYGEAHWVLAPDDNLRALVLGTTLDPEEYERERRRLLALRLEAVEHAAPPAVALPGDMVVVLDEDFDGTSLDERWQVYPHDVETWSGIVNASRFTVDRIVPIGDPAAKGGAKGDVTCTHEFPRLQDFRLRVDCGWESEDRETAMFVLIARLVDGHGSCVAAVAAADHWWQHAGEFQAIFGGATITRTGYDTMPPRGTAMLEIARAGDRIVFSKDGKPFAAATSDVPIVGLHLDFHYLAVDRSRGRSTCGTMWVDRVEMEGVETSRNAYLID